jgi:hypothetical protein
LQKQLQYKLFFWKMFKIQDQLVYVKLVHAQKLGPYLLTFVNLNLGVNPDVAYVYVWDSSTNTSEISLTFRVLSYVLVHLFQAELY